MLRQEFFEGFLLHAVLNCGSMIKQVSCLYPCSESNFLWVMEAGITKLFNLFNGICESFVDLLV